ncbi:MAG: hypothetical protein R3D71_02695 [Rickettsiales bacterium]
MEHQDRIREVERLITAVSTTNPYDEKPPKVTHSLKRIAGIGHITGSSSVGSNHVASMLVGRINHVAKDGIGNGEVEIRVSDNGRGSTVRARLPFNDNAIQQLKGQVTEMLVTETAAIVKQHSAGLGLEEGDFIAKVVEQLEKKKELESEKPANNVIDITSAKGKREKENKLIDFC